MLSRLKRKGDPPELTEINYTKEHVTVASSITRRNKLINRVWERIPIIRVVLFSVSMLWLLALPYHGLWKDTYVDEHAIQPAQVTMYFDWGNVHKADRYLDHLEKIVNGTFEERSKYLVESFRSAGLNSDSTPSSTYAHVTPPRSAGTETILLSANWISRDGTPNLRGIAMLLSLGEFLRGQNHWAFDFVLVIGEGYLNGLDKFMDDYYTLFPGVIWTALNIDYPGQSFSHLGLFYEGVNGRLPNQDVLNTVSHVARWAGGVEPRIHNLDESVPSWLPDFAKENMFVREYVVAAKHLLEHFRYMALGLPSAAHGVLASHRIDSVTMYCPPATGPHGFHTLGRTIESTLRSLNNLQERLHASYFFYLIPRPDRFIPVGHYLPAAILLGASITIGGFDCPKPLAGLIWILPSFILGLLSWFIQQPILCGISMFLPKPIGDEAKSMGSLAHLLFGALVPTLAMVNFPQAIVLGILTTIGFGNMSMARIGASIPLYCLLLPVWRILRESYDTVGNLTWVGVFAVWVPMWSIAASRKREVFPPHNTFGRT